MKRLFALVAVLVLATAGPVHAESSAQVAEALRISPVYQSAGLDLVDVAVLNGELSGRSPAVKVAILEGAAASSDRQARDRAVEIGTALGDTNAVVLVITANRHLGAGAGKGAFGRGVRAPEALEAERKDFSDFGDKDALTAFVTSFAERIANQASSGGTAGSPAEGGNSGLWVLGGLGVLTGGGIALAVRTSRKRRARLNEGLRVDVVQLYDRLGADVINVDAGENAVARQAMADASERYNACGAMLAQADIPAEFAAARRCAVEGLTAARTARTALGLNPGPDIPLVPGSGPQLAAAEKVTINGQLYDGSPEYQPGRPHYYGGGQVGGQQVPGGWYSGNFWEPFLLGTILSGGLGGFGGHGGSEGGDWGGSGGGDWGGPGGGADGGSGGSSGGGDW